MNLTLLTSGSTDAPKKITHTWDYINQCAERTIAETKLTKKDRVLDVFPSNTIAHYTITAYPAIKVKAELCTMIFDPYRYLDTFNCMKPTYISLIPRHLDILKKTKGFSNLDMSSVRYMVTGSSKIDQNFIDTFLERGVQLVANWYGMTEMPPPVLIGYNSTKFDPIPKNDYKINFTEEGECIINNFFTGDLFNLDTMEFKNRKQDSNGNTWKNNF